PRRTVGPVGASRTGRRVLAPPRPFGLEVLPGDPFVTADVAGVFGARPASRSYSPWATWSRRTPVAHPVECDALSASA
ncbi:hypothetical protein R5A26_17780, partial [Streptomyces prunicolor]|nr:hypothetical protein [Streptomyces prunicolor]